MPKTSRLSEKPISAIALALVLALPTLAQAASNVPISEVMLYPDGATITRAVRDRKSVV